MHYLMCSDAAWEVGCPRAGEGKHGPSPFFSYDPFVWLGQSRFLSPILSTSLHSSGSPRHK